MLNRESGEEQRKEKLAQRDDHQRVVAREIRVRERANAPDFRKRGGSADCRVPGGGWSPNRVLR